MADETTPEGEAKDTGTKHEGNVVSVRQVVSRIITAVDQARLAGEPVDAAALYPNAPKPQKNLEQHVRVVQLKRKHTGQAPRGKPSGMSDIKI